MTCKKIEFTEYKLCASDLSHRISIKKRFLNSGAIGSFQPNPEFIEVASRRCAIKTATGVNAGYQKFLGVGIDDSVTHLFYIRRDKTLEPFNVNETFIDFDNRRFRLVRADATNEDAIMVLQCSDRGVGEASNA